MMAYYISDAHASVEASPADCFTLVRCRSFLLMGHEEVQIIPKIQKDEKYSEAYGIEDIGVLSKYFKTMI
jgi:hypothetical protein